LLLGQTSADVKAHPESGDRSSARGPVVRREHPVALFGGDSEAVVLHADLGLAVDDRRCDVDGRAGRTVLDGVVQQVVEDLGDAIGVAAHANRLPRTIEREARSVFVLVPAYRGYDRGA